MIQATPLKFCLKYKPPTIAVVYTINATGKKKTTKQRKYIHSIHVDFNQPLPSKTPNRGGKPSHTTESLDLMCQLLCEQESAYLNTSIISKQQVSPFALRRSNLNLGLWLNQEALREGIRADCYLELHHLASRQQSSIKHQGKRQDER